MNKNDKNSILIIVYVVALAALAFVFCNTTKFINPFWLGVIMVVTEVFYLYPKVVKNYWAVFPRAFCACTVIVSASSKI